MARLNQWNFIGNLGKDPELREAASGKTVCELRVAVDSGRKDSDPTMWVSVYVSGKLAEIVASNLKKGEQIFVSGRLKATTRVSADGHTHLNLDVYANEIEFLGRRRRREDSPEKEDTPEENTTEQARKYPEPDILGGITRESPDTLEEEIEKKLEELKNSGL